MPSVRERFQTVKEWAKRRIPKPRPRHVVWRMKSGLVFYAGENGEDGANDVRFRRNRPSGRDGFGGAGVGE